jgi:sugar lactone lactonase YvrE
LRRARSTGADPEKGIYCSGLDGSNVERLVIPDLMRPDEIALDIAGGKMYWTDRPRGAIQRSDLDGSNIETLWYNSVEIHDLDLVEGKIYWTIGYPDFDVYVSVVARANVDGSEVRYLHREDRCFL